MNTFTHTLNDQPVTVTYKVLTLGSPADYSYSCGHPDEPGELEVISVNYDCGCPVNWDEHFDEIVASCWQNVDREVKEYAQMSL